MVSRLANDEMTAYWQGHGFEKVVLIDAKDFDDSGQELPYVDSTRFSHARRLAFAQAVLHGVDAAARAALGGTLTVFIGVLGGIAGFGAIGLFLGPVVLALIIALLTAWLPIARTMRGVVLSLREKEFVEAAHALGGSTAHIVFRHILPNTVDVIIVSATVTVAQAVLLESALSRLGYAEFAGNALRRRKGSSDYNLPH